MRDRETDSWWSIMTSSAIGGALEGSSLEELAVSEKARWGEWRSRYPHTQVLSVDGEEHDPINGYDEYFGSQDTFRDLEIDDQRMTPKTPIFGGWVDDEPFAVAHADFVGGSVIELSDDRALVLYRPETVEIFSSSRALVVSPAPTEQDAGKILAAIDRGDLAADPVSGFDTFWYSWVSVNTATAVFD